MITSNNLVHHEFIGLNVYVSSIKNKIIHIKGITGIIYLNSWKDVIFTVIKKVEVGSGYMYELKSDLYITASSTYVEALTKI